MPSKKTLSFKPKQITKKLLSVLSDRAQDVVTSRFGLGSAVTRQTLEAIGKKYKITRERVRQIENFSIINIRKSKEYDKAKSVFEEIRKVIQDMGGVITEETLLESLSKDRSEQNHLHFLLVIGDDFIKEKEDDLFKHRWHVDKNLADKIHNSLKKLYEGLNDEELVPESEMIRNFLEHVKDVSEQYKDEEVVKRWLTLSKKIGKNPMGEWGKAKSPNVNTKGVRDYAFLVIRKHGSPIHFRDVAKSIEQFFNKKAHVATTHNELIKDDRFVLVGRGLYALSEWGYVSGVVKDVIRKVLEKHGPLSKEKVTEEVLRERYVKENTIMVNLQNPKYFKKDKKGLYHIVK